MGLYGLIRFGSGQEPVEGFCEDGNKFCVFIKCWEVIEWLHNLQILRKGSAP
jgi:hypothetical protein